MEPINVKELELFSVSGASVQEVQQIINQNLTKFENYELVDIKMVKFESVLVKKRGFTVEALVIFRKVT